jgi:hypothetical protein
MTRAKRLHVEDLPPDFDWQATADRLAAAEKRKSDALWRRKLAARHHRKQGNRRQRTKH